MPILPLLSRRKVLQATFAGGAGVALGGCDTVVGALGRKPKPLEGQRYTILNETTNQGGQEAVQSAALVLGSTQSNEAWTHMGMVPSQAVGHLKLSGDIALRWSQDLGRGSRNRQQITAQPLIIGSAIYAMDSSGVLSCLRISDGAIHWRKSILPAKEKSAFGGGIVYAQERIFATNGTNYLLCLNANTGEILWGAELKGLARSAPVAAGGRVFVVTLNNHVQAFDAGNGSALWHHRGEPSLTRVLAGSGAAYHDSVLYVSYGSGQLYAFNARTGRPKWDEVLLPFGVRSAVLSSVTDTGTAPVIDGGVVYLTSASGRTGAYNSLNGQQIWEVAQGGQELPILTPSHLFFVSNDAQLVCLDRKNAAQLWRKALPDYRSQRRRTGYIQWFMPILANKRLFLTGSNGDLAVFDPFTGNLLARRNLAKGIAVGPTLAQNTMLIITNDGRLHAYR